MTKFLISACAVALICGAANAQNIVSNGGFEDGYTDWATFGVGIAPFGLAHGGNMSAATGCVGASAVADGGCNFFQTLNTTAGAAYDLSFWVDNNFAAEGGAEQYRVVFGGIDLGVVNFNGMSWTQVNYSGLVATSGATVLRIYGRNDPAGIFFDDISVVQSTSSPAPEPASWALMLGGFGAIGGALRARRKTAVTFA